MIQYRKVLELYFNGSSQRTISTMVGTPGAGFGPNGEGYFRLSAFNTTQNTLEAVKRLQAYYIK